MQLRPFPKGSHDVFLILYYYLYNVPKFLYVGKRSLTSPVPTLGSDVSALVVIALYQSFNNGTYNRF